MKYEVRNFLRENHVWISVLITAFCCAAAFMGAFVVRFDFSNIPDAHIPCLWIGLPIMVVIRLVALASFKAHRGLYRYASVYDFVLLFKAVSLGSIIFAAVWLGLVNETHVMPRSIYVLDWIFCMGLLVGLRLLVRLWRSHIQKKEKLDGASCACRALIVGAGNMGETIFRMVDRRYLGKDYNVVGFLDDNPLKDKSLIHGVPVLGHLDDVRIMVKLHEVKVIIFAISQPPQGLYERVMAECDGLHLQFNTVSVLQDKSSGELRLGRMHLLHVEDLLGRPPITVETGPVQESLHDRIVMVTGAGGSIGSELCRQIASFNPKKLILLDAGESPLFEIDRELRQKFPELAIEPKIGDIKHLDVIDRIFEETRPDYVYHAAAYKHVPLMEAHPDEAILNNVRGTRFLGESARRYGCKRFVMISSDKAVRPTNVMGATKRMCELVIQSLNGGDTVFTAVRFGNVLGSNGSVIPIFKKQIEAGGPLTITHEDMTRYFMTIPEAVTLVLQCGVIAEAGDVFVLDMGTPVKIMDLARNMLRLSGLQEGVDISIEVTGLRPGEKMYEELVAYGEELMPTHVPKVNVLKQKCDFLACDVLLATILRMEEIAEDRKIEESRMILWRMISLDNERAQKGLDGLIEKSRLLLNQEWLNSVRENPVKDPNLVQGKILSVVGDLENKEAVELTVSAAGFELECLDCSNEAVRVLCSNRDYSAVLCDYIMPRESAWKLKDKLRAAGLDVPVLAMSMYDSDRLAKVLEVDASIPVLKKPFTADEFLGVMKPLLCER